MRKPRWSVVEAGLAMRLDEIIKVRYHRATLLLRENTLPIKTVANLAGFGSRENMRQTFLHRAGLSPCEFRKTS